MICSLELHSLLLRLLVRVIEGGGIFLASLLQSYPCYDHPYKDNVRLWPHTCFHPSSSGHGSVMGLRPPRCHGPKIASCHYLRHYLTCKRLRFPQVRQKSYMVRRMIRHLLSLSHPSQPSDITLHGLAILRKGRIRRKRFATPSENLKQHQSSASVRDKPLNSHLDPVDDLLTRIDPITWFRRMTLCEESLLQGRQDYSRTYIAWTDLVKEKLERPYGWSPSTTPQQ